MKKNHKIIIDRILGLILCFILRLPAFFLEKFLRRNHQMPPSEQPKTIVVAKYLGIGSILQSTPMLKSLKSKYPDSKLIFLTNKANHSILSQYDFVDKVIYVDDTSLIKILVSSIQVIVKLLSERVDLFIDLEVHSIYGSLICLFSSAKNRLGFFIENANFKAYIYTHLLYLNANLPIRNCYNQLAQLVGVNILTIQDSLICPTIPYEISKKTKNQIKQIFNFKYKGIIAINANASDLSYERRWGNLNFSKVARHFANEGYAIALVGSSSEYEYIEEIINKGPKKDKKIVNLAGTFPLINFFAFLEHCDLLITNDSGIMNMALTLNVPQLLLSGPVNPKQYFMDNDYRAYIYYQTYCSPCTHVVDSPPCGGDNKCMQQIEPDEVIRFSNKLLNGKKIESKHEIIFSSSYETLGVLKNKGIL
jgi:ADP-heptose:LPS heptosyltransferase